MGRMFEVDRVYRDETGTVFFTPKQDFVPTVPPGYYNLGSCDRGYYFRPVDTQHSVLIPDPDQATLVEEIQTFWGAAAKYQEFGFQHKRGVVLHGPPGTGKSTIVRMLADRVVASGGLAVIMTGDLDDFNQCMGRYRQMSPTTPVVFMLEDLDRWNPSSNFLNCLDGLQPLEHILFVATTNHLDQVSAPLLRPSRFDRKIEVGMPGERMRRAYLEGIVGGKIDAQKLEDLVLASEGRSIADLKEVVLQMLVYGKKADEIEASGEGEDDGSCGKVPRGLSMPKSGLRLSRLDEKKAVLAAGYGGKSNPVPVSVDVAVAMVSK